MQVTTLLSRQHKAVLLLVLAHVGLLFAITYQKVVIEKTMCQAPMFSERVLSFQKVLFGAMFGVTYLYSCRYFSGSFRLIGGDNFASANRTSLFISMISAVSGLIQYINYFDTTCEDQLGVPSPVIQWVEWQASVPMMFYLNIALDDRKTSLTFADGFVILCSWASIASCWLLNFHLPSEFSLILLTLSTLFMFVALVLNVFLARSTYTSIKAVVDSAEKKCVIEQQYFRVVTRKYNASIFLLQVFPLFAIIYFLGFLEYIDKESVLIGFLVMNFLAKMMFSLWIMDAHHDILDTNTYVLLAEQKANASRRSFLRYVLHEVRVPLNSISMGLLLLDGENKSESGETITMMREAVSFMSDTLNDVLSIQKIEEGKLELQYENFLISDMLKTVHHSLRGQMVAKGLRMIVELDNDVPAKVSGDRFRIEHVLANILSNAVKFSPHDGTVTVTVKTVPRAADQGARLGYQIVEFTVIDEGVGISEEDQKKLFTHYTQIDPRSLQEGKGTGVGLAICKETIHLHEGRIGVRSKKRTASEKGGSEFFFSIDFEVIEQNLNGEASQERSGKEIEDGKSPMGKAIEPCSSAPLMTERNAPLDLKDMGSWNILIADDAQSNRKLLAMLLKKKGVKSHEVDDGVQCLECVDKSPDYFDLIFMDNMMPHMIGSEATKHIRKRQYNGIIIGLTGDAMDDEVEKFMTSGADIVLSKPLKFQELNKILEHLSIHGFDHKHNVEGYEENGNTTKLQRSCQLSSNSNR